MWFRAAKYSRPQQTSGPPYVERALRACRNHDRRVIDVTYPLEDREKLFEDHFKVEQNRKVRDGI